MAGWNGNGVQCTCPAAKYSRSAAAHWRFEAGRDTGAVSTFVQDVSRRRGEAYTADTRTLGAFGDGSLLTTSRDNDLEVVAATAPVYTVQAPQNATYAVLCVPNRFALEFSGAQWARTSDYAVMNNMALASFTWEVSVYVKSLAGEQTFIAWHNAAGDYYMRLYKTATSQFAFAVKTASTTITAQSNLQLVAQRWYHLAVTYDGGVAGMVRLFHLDTFGHGQTASDCVDAQCLVATEKGGVGAYGAGLGDGVLLLSTADLDGCAAGMTLSATGGGSCSVPNDDKTARPCTTDSDCSTGETCVSGSGFAATITAVNGSGFVTGIFITSAGHSYTSDPTLVASSAACTCAGNAGNVAGNLDPCLVAVYNTGRVVKKDVRWVHNQQADAPWDSMTGWGNGGDTSACTASSTEPCPFVAQLSTTPGWRWSLGRDGVSGSLFDGHLDEVRIHSQWIDLGDDSLWRP